MQETCWASELLAEAARQKAILLRAVAVGYWEPLGNFPH
jgi:hypothetical protein